MADLFDSYWEWLGISPLEQPPSLYRLLDLPEGEADTAIIVAAADRQMALVKQFAIGPRRRESQRMLNELSAARVVLLSPSDKAAYDARLASKSRPLPPPLPRRDSSPSLELAIERAPGESPSFPGTSGGSAAWRGARPGRRIAAAMLLIAGLVAIPCVAMVMSFQTPHATPGRSHATIASADQTTPRKPTNTLAPREPINTAEPRREAAPSQPTGAASKTVMPNDSASHGAAAQSDVGSASPSKPAEPGASQPRAIIPAPPKPTAAVPSAPAAASLPTSAVPGDAALPTISAATVAPTETSRDAEPQTRPLQRVDFAQRSWVLTLPDGSVLHSDDLKIPDESLAALARPGAEIYPWKDAARHLEGRFRYKHIESDKAFRLDGPGLVTERGLPWSMVTMEEGKREGAFLLFGAAGEPAVAGTYHNDQLEGAVWWIDRGVPLVAELHHDGALKATYLIVVDAAARDLAAVARDALDAEQLSTLDRAASSLAATISREDREYRERMPAFRKWVRAEQERQRRERAIALGPVKRRATIERNMERDNQEQIDFENYVNRMRRFGR